MVAASARAKAAELVLQHDDKLACHVEFLPIWLTPGWPLELLRCDHFTDARRSALHPACATDVGGDAFAR